MPNIEVREEFQSLVSPLTPEEFSQLERSVLAEGCRNVLVIRDGILRGVRWLRPPSRYSLLSGVCLGQGFCRMWR